MKRLPVSVPRGTGRFETLARARRGFGPLGRWENVFARTVKPSLGRGSLGRGSLDPARTLGCRLGKREAQAWTVNDPHSIRTFGRCSAGLILQKETPTLGISRGKVGSCRRDGILTWRHRITITNGFGLGLAKRDCESQTPL